MFYQNMAERLKQIEKNARSMASHCAGQEPEGHLLYETLLALEKQIGEAINAYAQDVPACSRQDITRTVAEDREVRAWTVISMNGDGVVTTTLQDRAGDPHTAMRFTANELRDDGDTQIICAVSNGGTLFIPPCEDSGKAAYIVDLKGDDEEPGPDIDAIADRIREDASNA